LRNIIEKTQNTIVYLHITCKKTIVFCHEKRNNTIMQRIHNDKLTSVQYDFSKYGTKKQQEYLQIVLKYILLKLKPEKPEL